MICSISDENQRDYYVQTDFHFKTRGRPIRDQRGELFAEAESIRKQLEKNDTVVRPLQIIDIPKDEMFFLGSFPQREQQNKIERAKPINMLSIHEITLSFRVISKYLENYTQLKYILYTEFPDLVIDVIPHANIKTRIIVRTARRLTINELVRITKRLGHCRILKSAGEYKQVPIQTAQ